jgi:hypothetical protein
MNRPIREVVTLEGDRVISTMTNQNGETPFAKRWRADDVGEEEEDNLSEPERQEGRSASNSTGGESGRQAGVGWTSPSQDDNMSWQGVEGDKSDNRAFLEAVEQEEVNEQDNSFGGRFQHNTS